MVHHIISVEQRGTHICHEGGGKMASRAYRKGLEQNYDEDSVDYVYHHSVVT